MHSCDDRGSLALYDASTDDFGLVRMLPNALAKCDEYSTRVIAVDDTGRRLAGIGPSEFLITVFDARSLDEVATVFFIFANYLESISFCYFLADIWICQFSSFSNVLWMTKPRI